MKVINNLPGEGSDQDKVIDILLGPKSNVYRVFQDALGLPYNKFAEPANTGKDSASEERIAPQ